MLNPFSFTQPGPVPEQAPGAGGSQQDMMIKALMMGGLPQGLQGKGGGGLGGLMPSDPIMGMLSGGKKASLFG